MASRQSLFRGPTGLYSGRNCGSLDSSVARPLVDGHTLSSRLKKMIGATIVGLILSGCPPAIIGTVRSVILSSVQGHSTGNVSHVFVEIIKGLQPSVTHLDSSASIVCKSVVFRVVAAPLYSAPNTVYRSPAFSVSDEQFGSLYGSALKAGWIGSTKQSTLINRTLVSAVAPTPPSPQVLPALMAPDDCVGSKLLTLKMSGGLSKFSHNLSFNMTSCDVNTQGGNFQWQT